MNTEVLRERVRHHLEVLCEQVGNRHVGSAGNRAATDYATGVLRESGWEVETPAFDCIDWKEGRGRLTAGGEEWPVKVSPYSLSFEGEADLVCVSNVEQLASLKAEGTILLLHGEIAREQIMPKNFVFYNPEHHQRLVALLEEKRPAAMVCVTGKNPEVAGSVYPFPMFEDGDLDIPSVYMKDVDGEKLVKMGSERAFLQIVSARIPSTARNVIARKAGLSRKRIVLTAHIDAKLNTPGALDNGTGVVSLLAAAELMQGADSDHTLEIALLNGEDYYAVPGQMHYLAKQEGRWDEIALVVNLDGMGYKEGRTAWSMYEVSEPFHCRVEACIAAQEWFMSGEPWYQGDHSMFIQQGVPAVAITTEEFEKICTEITHTPADNLTQVDAGKLAEVASALADLCTGQ